MYVWPISVVTTRSDGLDMEREPGFDAGRTEEQAILRIVGSDERLWSHAVAMPEERLRSDAEKQYYIDQHNKIVDTQDDLLELPLWQDEG